MTNLESWWNLYLRYDGVNFIIQGEGGKWNATASDFLLGKTATIDAAEIVGTIPSKVHKLILGTTNQVIPAGQIFSWNQTIFWEVEFSS